MNAQQLRLNIYAEYRQWYRNSWMKPRVSPWICIRIEAGMDILINIQYWYGTWDGS